MKKTKTKRDMNEYRKQKERSREISQTALEIVEIFKGRNFNYFEIEQALHDINRIVKYNAHL